MVRNESVARIAMFLCFGTAILSLAVHWRVSTTQQQSENSAFGASTIAGEPIAGNNYQSTDQLKSRKSEPVSQGVLNRRRLTGVRQEQQDNLNTHQQPLSLFSQISTQPKTANKLGIKTQVVVDLSDRRTYVYQGDIVIASYPIAIGKKGWETPTGAFEVMNMQHDPIWQHPITGKVFPPGNDSPLGERWIGFWTDGRNEIGFHGTPDIHLLGSAISHGCLRMRNSDVRLLYDQVKVGTLVTVRD